MRVHASAFSRDCSGKSDGMSLIQSSRSAARRLIASTCPSPLGLKSTPTSHSPSVIASSEPDAANPASDDAAQAAPHRPHPHGPVRYPPPTTDNPGHPRPRPPPPHHAPPPHRPINLKHQHRQ